MASAPPLLQLSDGRLGFGGAPLFAEVSLSLNRGERIAFIGHNGSGKSSLMKALAGAIELDAGEIVAPQGTHVARVAQDPDFAPGETCAAYAARVLARTLEVTVEADDHRAAAILDQARFDPDQRVADLSGGEARRLMLHAALGARPDVLLLDEPTNHLDLPGIEWLERRLKEFKGALMVISHDRRFLMNVSNRMLWLDMGVLRSRDEGFMAFARWSEEIEAQRAAELARWRQHMKAELRYMQRGVTGRRRRNERRVRELAQLKQARAELIRRRRYGDIEASDIERSGDLVIRARKVGKGFTRPDGTEREIVRDFSLRVFAGERIGVIGANGAGKTTLVKLLIGELEPDTGKVRLGDTVGLSWFDQNRAALKPAETPWSVLAGRNDTLKVGEGTRHVLGYLKEWLFPEDQARQPVSALSGGERNRLLLAKIMAAPGNLLVLDEPTNDLDMDTLDLLEMLLEEYEGTLILVSHDRDFLDRIVTSTLVLEGDGTVQEYAGGYSDYLSQRRPDKARTGGKTAGGAQGKTAAAQPEKPRSAKLSYKEQRALELLPAEIGALEAQLAALQEELADPELYARDPKRFHAATAELETAQAALDAAETRWLELEARRDELQKRAG